MKKGIAVVAISLLGLISRACAQETPILRKQETTRAEIKCPMHGAHSKINERAEKGMGFSQTATMHHFLLRADGGVIQVEAKDSADTSIRDDVRRHLMHISEAFANGDFDIPMFVHDTVPSGVPEMKSLREKIHYSFEETASGGRVVMSASDKDALTAIHSFIAFQIKEHETGDPIEMHQTSQSAERDMK
jgi:hypothetical protein